MRSLSRRIAVLVIVSLLLVPQLAAAGPPAPAEQRAFLSVKLNGKDQGTSLVVLFEKDAYVLASDLKDSNLVVPGDAYRTVDGQRYVSLRAVDPNVTFTIDTDALTIDVRLGTSSFGQTTLDVGGIGAALPISYTRSGFFNYAVTKSAHEAPSFSGEAVASMGRGVFDTYLQRGASGRFAFGQTSWTRDYAEKAERLVLGRSDIDVSDFSGTGSVVSMNGVTFRRDTQLNPGTIRNFNTAISGVASSASTVQLYVNGTLVREEQIGAGAFRIANVPLRDGANDTTVVIRDAFGHTQTISRPTYIGAEMYRRGEREFAFGIGRASSSELEGGRGMVGAARYAAGITDGLTAGTRAQVSADVWNAGSWLAAGTRVGQFSASFSASGARAASFAPGTTVVDAAADTGLPPAGDRSSQPPAIGPGRIGGSAYGLSYNGAFRRIGVGVSLVGQSPYYSTFAQSPLGDRALRAERLYVSGSLPRSGTGVTFSWSRATNRDRGPQADQSLSVTQQLARGVNASLAFGRRTVAGVSAGSMGIRIDAVLRRHDQLTLSSENARGRTSRTIQLEHRPDGVLGTAYSAQLGTGGDGAVASFDAVDATPVGTLEVRHVAAGAFRDTSVSFSGAVAMAGGGVFLTRPILQSFVVVDAGGVSGLRALVNNQSAGVTDRKGRILIADLFPYQRNDVSIDPNSIPDGALLDVSQQSVAPSYRGAAVVKFAVHRVRAYSGRLVFEGDPDKSPALGEITLTLRSGTAVSDIGTDGTFYFDDLEPGRYDGRAAYKGGACSVKLHVPASSGPLTELGVVACAKAVAP
jgi:outer membrane usher protein